MIDADDLPDGWVLATLGEVTEPKVRQGEPSDASSEFTYIDITAVDNFQKTIAEAKNLPVKGAPSRARQHVRPGDVLVSMTRPNLNAVAVVPESLAGSIASTGFHVLRPKEVLPEWLFTIVRSTAFVTAMSELVQGALYPAVRPSDIRDFTVPVPPLAEQRRIVAKIEELTARSRAARAALAEVPTLLEQFRQSVLASAFRGDLTADWRERHPDTEPASVLLNSGISLPEGEQRRRKISKRNTQHVETDGFGDGIETWAYLTVQELYDACAIVDYADGNHGSLYPRKEEFGSEGAIFITAQQIQDGCIDFDAAPRLKDEKASQITKGWAKGGDVLLTHNATVGRTARVPDGRGRFLLGTSATYYRPNPLVLDSDFLYLAVTAPQWQRQLTSVMEQTTRNQVSIQKQAFFVLPLPPLREQREIVRHVLAKLAAVRQIELAVERILADVNQLDQSILAKAFRGELVPQDPADEPASVLLERIRNEREAGTNGTTAAPKKRRTKSQ